MSKAQSSFAEKEMEAYGKERTFTLTVFLIFYKVIFGKKCKSRWLREIVNLHFPLISKASSRDLYAKKEGHSISVLLFHRRVLLLRRYWPAYGQLWHLAASRKK